MMDTIFSWNTVWWIMLFIYVPSCLGLIIVVLLQKGKGVGFAGAFGAGGGSDAVFGPRSSKSLPQRITYSMAALFMLLSLLMSMLSGSVGGSAAPELVKDTGSTSGKVSSPAGSLGALFNDNAPAEKTPAAVESTPAETTKATPAEAVAPTEEATKAAAPAKASTTEGTEAATPAEEAPAKAPAPQ